MKNCAIIGAGWSGLTASYLLAQHGFKINLFEAGKIAGGRARTIDALNVAPHLRLDNGQHILIGAYEYTLDIMQKVGVNITKELSSRQFQWHVHNGLTITANKFGWQKYLTNNLNIFINIALAKKFSFKYKYCFINVFRQLYFANFIVKSNTVAQWYEEYNIPNILIESIFTPMCLSIMNTSIKNADVNKFLYIIGTIFNTKNLSRSSLNNSDYLVPNTDLSNLFPNKVLENLQKNQHNIYLNTTTKNIQYCTINKKWQITDHKNNLFKDIDVLILACNYNSSCKLLEKINIQLPKIQFNPISTIYVNTEAKISTDIPFLVYKDLIIFQKSNNIWAIVCSNQYINTLKASYIVNKLSHEFKKTIEIIKVICEKNATFNCAISHPKIEQKINNTMYLVGDYLHNKYPSTLESSVYSAYNLLNYLF